MKIIKRVRGKFINSKIFFRSKSYWNERYKSGGNSGEGSYKKYAEYKSKIINDFIEKNKIYKMIDFGCGDGNQTSDININNYLGFDVSKKAIELCKNKYCNHTNKEFLFYKNFKQSEEKIKNFNASLAISLDVIFHLVEDKVFFEYIKDLFRMSSKYVIIYSTNLDRMIALHHRDRRFTNYIGKNILDWQLLYKLDNPHKGNHTQADFYIYIKNY